MSTFRPVCFLPLLILMQSCSGSNNLPESVNYSMKGNLVVSSLPRKEFVRINKNGFEFDLSNYQLVEEKASRVKYEKRVIPVNIADLNASSNVAMHDTTVDRTCFITSGGYVDTLGKLGPQFINIFLHGQSDDDVSDKLIACPHGSVFLTFGNEEEINDPDPQVSLQALGDRSRNMQAVMSNARESSQNN